MMNKFSFLLLLTMGLVAQVTAQVFPTSTLINNGDPSRRINLVFVGDGYTSAQQTQFITNATTVANSLFAQSPFSEYSDFFNVYAIQVPSTATGAKHPGTATDVTEPAFPVASPANYFGSTFDVSNIHRLLAPTSYSAVQSVLASNTPYYDQAFILVNSTQYGGSGGTYATSSIHSSANEIAIHEIGHSFANLGDEYWFNCAERKNRTANNNSATIVWKNWLNTNSIGIYSIPGATTSCYRPHQNCKMQVLGVPFCSVCKEAFIDKIYALISPIDNMTPASSSVNFTGTSLNFSLDLILPNPNTLVVTWKLNGTVTGGNTSSIEINGAQLQSGNNTLVAEVTDGTTLSRVYQPATSGYLHSVSWTIANLAPVPVEWLDFNAQLVKNKAVLDWSTATERQTSHFNIQKSTDNTSFSTIGKVAAAGSSATRRDYAFTDPESVQDMTYYRIEQVDQDGKSELSPIKMLNRVEQLRYEIYPNPVEDFLGVQVSTRYAGDIELSLYDMNGALLYTIKREGLDFTTEHIDMAQWPAGNYLLKIASDAGALEKMIVKQ